MDAQLVDYHVTVVMQGEAKDFDVRSISAAQCENDFRQVYQPYGPVEIRVSIAPDARFKVKN